MTSLLQKGALAGIRVADFSWVWAGPYATSLLGYLGAEVIKIESRKRVDQTRQGSIIESENFSGYDNAPPFNNANLNKKGICADISRPEGAELAKRVVATCDVVLANMRPGKMDKIGLGYDELVKVKPDIIMIESTGFGSTGPYREFSGFAPIFASFGGLSYLTGYADDAPNPMSGVQDLRVGTQAAFAVLAALLHRQKTGEGQYIDLSSSEAITTLVGNEMMEYTMNGRSPFRCGNHDAIMAPHNVYRCKGEDCWLSIAVATDAEWQALCRVMGSPAWAEDRRFADAYSRHCNEALLDEKLAAWCLGYDKKELMVMLQDAGVAAMPSFSASDILQDVHTKARGVIMVVDHPAIGAQYVLTPPWKLSATPATVRTAAPCMGADNHEIYHERLGIPDDELARLEREKIIY